MSSKSARSVFQVGELVGTLRHGLEMTFPSVWVEGEISNFLSARSGHWYFTLKDDDAQLRCVYFRFQRGATPSPAAGQHVLVRGKASIYQQRGELQLILDHLEDAGEGALRRAFEALKRQLEVEGLFAPDRKIPIPARPRCIGLITSPQGAAIHDVLTTLQRRNPLLRVIVYSTAVQGREAPPGIVQAIASAQARAECDVLLLTRGGGSLEDLQAFNEEAVARAIAGCELPIISAIGHEVDFSIADFVADERAATPTAAAERLSPDLAVDRQRLIRLRSALLRTCTQHGVLATHRTSQLRDRLRRQSPRRKLEQQAQRLDDLTQRVRRAESRQLERSRSNLQKCLQGLFRADPRKPCHQAGELLGQLQMRLCRAGVQHLAQRRNDLARALRSCRELSPQRTLARGYTIAWQAGHVVARRSQAQLARPLRLQFYDADLEAELKTPKTDTQ